MEHTRDRRVQNLFLGTAYIGAIQEGKIVVVPYLWNHREELRELMPLSMQRKGYEMVRGIPSTHCFPFTLVQRKRAKTKVARDHE